uniref:Uncharacterized protein n=1 Tax=Grapevine-associated RNA virus 12 TaxID=2814387 RepID=A0A8F5ML20_9VIRU|nr:MAG: hypothetical protein [Grapevine-associated RNA virus 12]
MSARVRPRSRWVNVLQTVLGEKKVGAYLRGRWLPDLPLNVQPAGLKFMLTFVKDGVRVIGGGSVQSPGGGKSQVYLVVELSDGSREVVFPDLVSRLAQYVLLRQRTPEVVAATRSRARDWCKQYLPEPLSYVATVSALRLALTPTKSEEALSGHLGALGINLPPLFSLQ